jgi:hypothetical protein
MDSSAWGYCEHGVLYRPRGNYIEILFYALFRPIEYYYFFSSATVPPHTYIELNPV